MFKPTMQTTLLLILLAVLSSCSVSVACPPICEKVCKSGFRKDINGCEYCECVDPCEETTCGFNQHCVSKACKKEPCYHVAECESCGGICKMLCQNGFKTDERGCPICQCASPCDKVNCANDSHCVAKDDVCLSKPCKQVAECVKNKQVVSGTMACRNNCQLMCKSGLRKDIDGCDVCQCVNPCESKRCPRGMHCRRREMTCLTSVCYDVAECKCHRRRCHSCQHGYVTNRNGCKQVNNPYYLTV